MQDDILNEVTQRGELPMSLESGPTVLVEGPSKLIKQLDMARRAKKALEDQLEAESNLYAGIGIAPNITHLKHSIQSITEQIAAIEGQLLTKFQVL